MKKTETASRKQNKPEFETPDPKVLRHSIGNLSTKESKEALIMAAEAVKPENSSAFVMADYPLFGGAGVTELVAFIQIATAKIKAGDLSDAEAMLFSQAKALETIFTSLAKRAAKQDIMSHFQTFLTLALKAQSQSRSTIQALTELKFPRQVIMKQTNVSNGAQQINNGGDVQETAARTQENESLKNKLSPQIEDTRHERETLDFGTAAAAGRENPAMVPVGKSNRTKDRKG